MLDAPLSMDYASGRGQGVPLSWLPPTGSAIKLRLSGTEQCSPLIQGTSSGKKEELTKKPKEETTLDDPIKRLTNKFIDGEITEEEYEKKMALIKKHYPR